MYEPLDMHEPPDLRVVSGGFCLTEEGAAHETKEHLGRDLRRRFVSRV